MLFGHDRLIGCLVKSGTMISAEALFTKQYATTAAAIGTPCPGQMKWPIVPPSARCAKPAACIATMTVAAFTSIRRGGCERL